ncbi:helicase associated domain-containing protein [Embleya sp. AB8]|uniref:helicase associated domain-containing protein n=1 Tax=Embleya sp. AB8 TaxID=3156304 RepID=UPI003C7665F0
MDGGGAADGDVAMAAGGDVGGPGADRSGARAHRRGRGAWETAFAAAVDYREREGDLEVPRAHGETVHVTGGALVEGGAAASVVGGSGTGPGPADGGAGERVEVRLGKWINNQRNRRGSLNEERVRLLTELDMRW